MLKCTLIALLSSACIAQAEEIAPFKVTDAGGSLSLMLISDSHESISQGIVTQNTENLQLQEKLSLRINSYAYHPNFLQIDFGAGLLFDKTTFDSFGNSSTTKQRVNDLSASFNFLSRSATPFSFYYRQSNTTTTPDGSSGSYLLENVNYGANLSILAPLSPATMKLSAERDTNYGKGADQVTDNINERIRLDVNYSYGNSSYIKVSQQNNNRISRSGSLNLAITDRETSSSLTTINTKNFFGSFRKIRLDTRATYYKQDEFPGRESWFFGPTLNWKHNSNFTSYYTYATSHSDQYDIESENNKTTARLNYNNFEDSFGAGIRLGLSNNKSTVFESEEKSASFNIRKNVDASYGKYIFSYDAGMNTNEQISSGLISVSEAYVLSGLVTLNNEYIDTNSIIVETLDETQTYNEGTDYTITVIGSQTFIEIPIIGSNMTEGQSYLISYDYETGGTIKYDTLTQRLNITLAIGEFYNLNAQFYKTEQNLKEGLPTIALNSSDGVVLSLRIKRQLENGIALAGRALAQQHNEDNNPYNKQSIDTSAAMPLFKKAKLNLNAGLSKQEYENLDTDVSQKTLGLRISGRPWAGIGMSFSSQYSQTDGTTKRTSLTNGIYFDWRYRKLDYRANIKQHEAEQGTTEDKNWSINMKLVRSF